MFIKAIAAAMLIFAAMPAWADEAADKAAEDKYQAEMTARRQLLEKRVERGSPESAAQLAAMLQQGIGGPADNSRAFDLYEKAAQGKNVIGLRKMCTAYLLGEGRPVDLSKGLNACYALPPNDAGKLFGSAYDYDKGLTGPKDEEGAISLYVSAVDYGSGEAADALGQKAQAMDKTNSAHLWYRKGAALGSADAMERLAKMVEATEPGEAAWLRVFAKGGVRPPEPWSIDFVKGSREVRLNRFYMDQGKLSTQVITYTELGKLMTGMYPAKAEFDAVGGRATIFCYINLAHELDVCVVPQEFPIGYGFGRILNTLFDSKITIDAVDAKDAPTAGRTLAITLLWNYY